MIKYISLDLQGTLSDSKFSDYFWLEILPKKYSEKFNISITESREILRQKFKEYGVYNILYYDDKYWSEYLEFNTIKELDKIKNFSKINQELFEFISKISLPKIIISTTTELFINYELKDKIKLFEKIYSCVDYFGIGGKTSDIYQKISEELNVKPNEILHIGDNNLMDIENAKKAGVRTVLFDGDTRKTIKTINDIIKNYI